MPKTNSYDLRSINKAVTVQTFSKNLQYPENNDKISKKRFLPRL